MYRSRFLVDIELKSVWCIKCLNKRFQLNNRACTKVDLKAFKRGRGGKYLNLRGSFLYSSWWVFNIKIQYHVGNSTLKEDFQIDTDIY